MNTQINFVIENRLIVLRAFLRNFAKSVGDLGPEEFVLAADTTKAPLYISGRYLPLRTMQNSIFLDLISVIKTLFKGGDK